MKKRLLFLGLMVMLISLNTAYAEIKTADYEVAYDDRRLIDLNTRSPITIRVHETSLVSFRYPGRTKNTLLLNNVTKEGINVTMLGDAYETGLDVFIKAGDYHRVFANSDKIPDVIIEPKVYKFSDDPKQRTVTLLFRRVEIIQGQSLVNTPVDVSPEKITGRVVEERSEYTRDIVLYSSIIAGALLMGCLYFYFDRKGKKQNIKENKESSQQS